MWGQRRRTLAIVILVGLLAGVGLGLWYGWVIDPVQYDDTDMAHLYGTYRDEYVLMVGAAYAVDGDLDTARARLALLSLPEPAEALADAAEAAIQRDDPRLDIEALARLAAAMGAQRAELGPYLGSSAEAQ